VDFDSENSSVKVYQEATLEPVHYNVCTIAVFVMAKHESMLKFHV
jgi:hypothetical protein